MLTSGPVSETVVDAVARELLRARSAEDEVTLKAGVHDLDDDFAVCEANDKTVLRRVAVDKLVLNGSILDLAPHTTCSSLG